MLAEDVLDEEEAETGALDAGGVAAGDAVEALEDAFLLAGGKAEAGVGYADDGVGVLLDEQRDADVHAIGGVLDGVFEDVDEGGAEIFGDAEDVQADGAGNRLEGDGVGREVVLAEDGGDGLGEEGLNLERAAIAMALAELASFEDALDGGMKALRVGEHDAVELLPLVFVYGAALQGFEVEADGGDGGLELVGDGVEEGVLALVAADFSYEEDSVEDDAGEQGGEEDDAEDEQGDAALVEDDPADVEGDGNAGEQDSEDDGESDGTAALSEIHGRRGR